MLNDIAKIRVALQFIAKQGVVTPGAASRPACMRACAKAGRVCPLIGRRRPPAARSGALATDNIVEAAARATGYAISETQAKMLHHLLDRDSTGRLATVGRLGHAQRLGAPLAVRPRPFAGMQMMVSSPTPTSCAGTASGVRSDLSGYVNGAPQSVQQTRNGADRARAPPRACSDLIVLQTAAGSSAFEIVRAYVDCVHTTLEKGA